MRVVMKMEEMRLGGWNEESVKENEADGMKQEVDSKDAYRKERFVVFKEDQSALRLSRFGIDGDDGDGDDDEREREVY